MATAVLAVALTAAVAAHSGAANAAATTSGEGVTVRLALKATLAYLPLFMMIDDGILERELPGIKVETAFVNSGPDAATGFLAGKLDATIVGTTVALTAWAQKIPWKIMSGTSAARIELVTTQPRIQSLRDLGPGDRISVPGASSIQEIVLAMAAKRQLGDAGRFTNQLVRMLGSDAVGALQSKQIAAAFLQSPDLEKAMALPGAHVLLDSNDIVGSATLGVLVVRNDWSSKRPDIRKAFALAYQTAMESITKDPRHAAAVANKNGIGTSIDGVIAAMTQSPFTVGLNSIEKIAKFMYANRMMSRPFVRAELYTDETPPTLSVTRFKRFGDKVVTRVVACDDSGSRMRVTQRITMRGTSVQRIFSVVPKMTCGAYQWTWRIPKNLQAGRAKIAISLHASDAAGNATPNIRRTGR